MHLGLRMPTELDEHVCVCVVRAYMSSKEDNYWKKMSLWQSFVVSCSIDRDNR